jgi:Superinfection immunity protein
MIPVTAGILMALTSAVATLAALMLNDQGRIAAPVPPLVIAIILIPVMVFYFVPVIIATERKTKKFNVIFSINLVFGWLVLGWIAALIWAITEAAEPTSSPPSPIKREGV